MLKKSALIVVLAVFVASCHPDEPALVGWASLPADSFVDGPTSGQFIRPANGRTPPFEGLQPIQGFSAILIEDDGTFLGLPDNGFGARENSADFVLRVYRLRPDFLTEEGGSGTIEVSPEFELNDSGGLIPWPIVADSAHYPGSSIDVDPSILARRLLTGADFDVESFRRVNDGTFWFGDEFGPFLLHSDSTGRLLEPPFSLPGVWSPQHPELGDREPNLPRSGGFEAMALDLDGRHLIPMLEEPLVGEEGRVRAYRFDTREKRYVDQQPGVLGDPVFWYRLSPGATNVTELTCRTSAYCLTIERDKGQGPTAEFKKVFAIDLTTLDASREPRKVEWIDLLRIADPAGLRGPQGSYFTYPFETTEALDFVDGNKVAIMNDNNYPFSTGRFWEEKQPDPSELIVVSLP